MPVCTYSPCDRSICLAPAGNILLLTDEAQAHGFSAKISDFGMCRIKDMDSVESLQGTYSHMAPEVIESRAFSEVSSFC
jgi:serine/threonine protein kinase